MKLTKKNLSKNNVEMVDIKEKKPKYIETDDIKEKKNKKQINIESSDEDEASNSGSSENSEIDVIEKPKRKVNYVLTDARKANILKMQKARNEKIEARKLEKQKLEELKKKELE